MDMMMMKPGGIVCMLGYSDMTITRILRIQAVESNNFLTFTSLIDLDKGIYLDFYLHFLKVLILPETICCGYLLELPC